MHTTSSFTRMPIVVQSGMLLNVGVAHPAGHGFLQLLLLRFQPCHIFTQGLRFSLPTLQNTLQSIALEGELIL